MLQLGWKAAPEQFPPTELTNYAIDAEKAGFDLIDVSDHFHPWSEAGQSSFTWTWLGAVAVQTNRIHMGPGVTCPTLRYHPSIIAQASATVSCYAPNRTYLGVGTGEALNEYAATGMWPSYKERQERLVEAIELIRALWSGEEVTFEGKYYQTRKAKLFTPPASKIPLYISTVAPTAVLRKIELYVLKRLLSTLPISPGSLPLQFSSYVLLARSVLARTVSAVCLASAAGRRACQLHACSCSDDTEADAKASASLPSRAEGHGNVLHALSHRGTWWDPFDCLLI